MNSEHNGDEAGSSGIDTARLPHAWRAMSDLPDEETAVLVYFGNLQWPDDDGKPVSFGPLRDHVERAAIGFYRRGAWLEAGTAHDMWDRTDAVEYLPTHWMPLPAAPNPSIASQGKDRNGGEG